MNNEITQEVLTELRAVTFDRDDWEDLVVLEPINGEPGTSDILSDFLVTDMGFCGCACHDAAIEFLLIQLAGLRESKNYFHLNGGLEFFKLGCYELGLLDDNQKLTEIGEVLADLGNKIPTSGITLPESVFGHKLDFREDELKFTTFSILTDRTSKSVPEWINKDLLMEAIHYLLNGLDRESSKDRDEEMVLYNYREKHGGECTLLLYWLEHVLELEEHGSSTPGWIDHTSEFKWDHLKDTAKGYIKFTRNLSDNDEICGFLLAPYYDWETVRNRPDYIGYEKI